MTDVHGQQTMQRDLYFIDDFEPCHKPRRSEPTGTSHRGTFLSPTVAELNTWHLRGHLSSWPRPWAQAAI